MLCAYKCLLTIWAKLIRFFWLNNTFLSLQKSRVDRLNWLLRYHHLQAKRETGIQVLIGISYNIYIFFSVITSILFKWIHVYLFQNHGQHLSSTPLLLAQKETLWKNQDLSFATGNLFEFFFFFFKDRNSHVFWQNSNEVRNRSVMMNKKKFSAQNSR